MDQTQDSSDEAPEDDVLSIVPLESRLLNLSDDGLAEGRGQSKNILNLRLPLMLSEKDISINFDLLPKVKTATLWFDHRELVDKLLFNRHFEVTHEPL